MRHYQQTRLVVLVVLLAAGLLSHVAAWPAPRDAAWLAATSIGLLFLALSFASELKAGRIGVDVIALLAMAGCIALGEYLAGAVIALMFASGQALEEMADRRAQRALTALAGRAPRTAYRVTGEQLESVAVDEVVVGDELLVKSGDVLPVDGRLVTEAATLDESALTGEAIPVDYVVGSLLRSGTVNAGVPFHLTAVTSAKDSTYAGIVRMVERARASRAPLVRLADQWAWWFFALTIGLATAAWIISGQSVRALSVIVVATPCPLIIAAPVAIVAGLSRIARDGVILKGGSVLERLSRVRVLLFDKTGTLTGGNPVVKEIVPAGTLPAAELLRLAASVDQLSSHPLSMALRNAAKTRGLRLENPTETVETHGGGIRGLVGGHAVAIGKAEYVGTQRRDQDWLRHLRRRALLESMTTIFIAIDHRLAGAFLVTDALRSDASRTVRILRNAGINRVVMVTGDHPAVANSIAAAVGLDAVMAEHSPPEKAIAVEAEAAEFGPVAFVGDGINDAPALATADVGIAIGSRGISAASEAADAVLVADRLDPLAAAVRAARRSRFIALQSIAAGIGLSVLAMLVAAAGYLPPVGGAVLQEGIDLLVILNALRALGTPGASKVPAEMSALSARLREEHAELQGGIEHLRWVADRADSLSQSDLHRSLREVSTFIESSLLPHEIAEERRFYPLVAKQIGGDDPTATMMRGHVEITRLSRLLVETIAPLGGSRISGAELADIRRLLYSLYAVMTLHNAQEEEAYLSLAPPKEEVETTTVSA